jgi:hypothetical protein
MDFDPKKEKVRRQVTAITPERNAYPELQKNRLTGQLSGGERVLFERDGVTGLISREEDALEVAATFARYRYGVQNAYISDIGAGVYTMLTRGTGLYDKRLIYTRDESGNEEVVGARVILSMSTLYKALLGPLVDDNGRAISGAGPIVKEAKKAVMPIINGESPMPRAYASIEKKQKDGTKISAMIEGEPLSIYRKITGAKDAVVVDLDYFFFPAVQTEDGYKVAKDSQYLHQVAGLTSFLSFGRYLTRQRHPGSYPDTTTARKILLAAQAAYELRYFAPDIVRENRSGRLNIALRRRSVNELYPSAVDNTTGWIRFKDFSRAVADSGQFFRAALDATGIGEVLPNSVLIPAEKSGAEFPKDKPNIVYVKADQVKK